MLTLIASALLAVATTPVDTMVDVGGHRLHFVIHRGTEPVTIVLETGGAATLESWAGLDTLLAQRTRATVVAYERAGFGKSELGPADLLPATQVRQLADALTRLRVPARRIVIGASYGGLLAVVHAERFAKQVAGLVLLDPMNARFVDATGDFINTTVPHITEPKNDGERAVMRLVNTFGSIRDLARVAEPKLQCPIVVLSASRSVWNREAENRAWRASHEAMAAASPRRRLVVAENSGHMIARDRPDLVVEAVKSLL